LSLTQYLSSSAIPSSVLVLYSFYTGPCSVQPCPLAGESYLLQSSSNPLKVALGVPSRGHSVKEVIFSCCHANLFLVTAGKIYLTVGWQWTSILKAWGTCLSRVAQQMTIPAGCHVNVSSIRYLGTDISLRRGFTCHNVIPKGP
jgi:hypothetical protein